MEGGRREVASVIENRESGKGGERERRVEGEEWVVVEEER